MPAGFERCRKRGGKIRTVKPTKSTYKPICIIGGKSYGGELHHVKGKAGEKSRSGGNGQPGSS